MRKETEELLRDLYGLSHIQADLSKDDLSMDINWADLRLRIEEILIREGVELPKLPEMKTA